MRTSMIALICVLVVSLGGCTVGGSMRVEVEVYKGPLSKEPALQWAELEGLLENARSVFERMKNQMGAIKKQCATPVSGARINKDLCSRFAEAADYGFIQTEDILKKFKKCDADVHVLDSASLKRDSDSLQQCYKQVAQRAGALASHLQADAFLEARTHVAHPSDKRGIRALQVTYSSYLAEIANQLSSRADVLLKQMQGDDRRILPLSIYLRDAEPTEFLDLYIWNHAGGDAFYKERGWLNPMTTVTATRDRVRSVKRLFGDHNWKRINTVYGSGKGKMGTVLVKDDIGNWTLKAFDNDPSELLKAYNKAGLAALKTAADLAGKAGGVGGAEALLGFANRAALGHGPASGAVQEQRTVTAMRQSTIMRLESLKGRQQAEKTKLEQAIPEKENRITEQKTKVETAEATAKGEHTESKRLRGEAEVADARAAELRVKFTTIATGGSDAEKPMLSEINTQETEQRKVAEDFRNQADEKDALATRFEKDVEPQRKVLASLEKELAELKATQAGLRAKYKGAVEGLLDDLQHNVDLLESMTAEGAAVTGGGPTVGSDAAASSVAGRLSKIK